MVISSFMKLPKGSRKDEDVELVLQAYIEVKDMKLPKGSRKMGKHYCVRWLIPKPHETPKRE